MIEKLVFFLRSIGNIKFEEADKLILLALPVAYIIFLVIIWLLWLYRRPQKTYASKFPLFGRFKLWIFLIVMIAILIFAYAKPYITQGNLIVKRGNAEVVFIVDYSASMLLKDVGLARIDIAKRELLKLTSSGILKEGDRAALFILGKKGVRYLPLTSDLDGFANEVSGLGLPRTLLGSNIYWGSDVGSTLESVFTSLDRQDAFVLFREKNPPSGWRPEIKSNRLVIFIGDGDYFNYQDDERQYAAEDRKYFENGLNEFRKRGLKIYPIGIGTRTGGNMIDILRDYVKDLEYESRLEEDLKDQKSSLNGYYLEYMRNATGANRLFLIDRVSADASDFIKSVIDSHRNILIEPTLSQEPELLWEYFLIISLFIFGLGVLVTRF